MIGSKFQILILVLLAAGYVSANAQEVPEAKAPGSDESKRTEKAAATPTEKSPEQLQITIALVSGGKIVVDEVSEEADGLWYKRGNISTFIDRVKVARIERPKPPEAPTGSPSVQGRGRWKLDDAERVMEFFLATFKRPIPLSAYGQSELHDRWRWDHRNGMDVGLHPDSMEGRALISFLRTEEIPFSAFRSAIPGVATGPHIHIGNPSPRLSVR